MLRCKLLLLCILLYSFSATAAEREVPRIIIAFYDKTVAKKLQSSLAHSLAEMPLNHLGMKLEYHDINAPLPAINNRKEVRGVISWFDTETHINDPETYLRWAASAVDAGKKFVIMGNPAFYTNSHGIPTSVNAINYFLKKLGIYTTLDWENLTYATTFNYHTKEMFLPGKIIDGLKPSYVKIALIDDAATSYLTAYTGTSESQMVTINQNGGYVADGYSYSFHEGIEEEIRQWHVNPFVFFRQAFQTDDLPKADTTTLAGRRIFYSHIDGDGWNNYTQIEEYKKNRALSSTVIMEKVAKAYPDLPVTLTVIGADIDPSWSGTALSRKVAQEFFALPNVEAGTHTYSHPFSWAFFEDGKWEKEQPYLHLYSNNGWAKPNISSLLPLWSRNSTQPAAPDALPHGYTTPRAYAAEPFSVEKEVNASIQALTPLLPAGKKVALITWPGDCSPWEEVITLARKAGVQNINGGDSRFDPEYPSYASVAPIGRPVGREQQVYASSSNENTYTNLWNGRFYGFKYLMRTNQNTETPLRIKPLNVYYHIYSGEKQASLNALIDNLNYAESQEITPITTRQFTSIATGFYSIVFTELGTDQWRINNRGELNTIRFDQSSFKTVDFSRSYGVIGQRHFQGSLYVYVDKAVREPIIALKKATRYHLEAEEDSAYLVQSRWQIENLSRKEHEFSFTAAGFGKGEMVWQVPEQGRYSVNMGNKNRVIASDSNRFLHIALDEAATTPMTISIHSIKTLTEQKRLAHE